MWKLRCFLCHLSLCSIARSLRFVSWEYKIKIKKKEKKKEKERNLTLTRLKMSLFEQFLDWEVNVIHLKWLFHLNRQSRCRDQILATSAYVLLFVSSGLRLIQALDAKICVQLHWVVLSPYSFKLCRIVNETILDSWPLRRPLPKVKTGNWEQVQVYEEFVNSEILAL